MLALDQSYLRLAEEECLSLLAHSKLVIRPVALNLPLQTQEGHKVVLALVSVLGPTPHPILLMKPYHEVFMLLDLSNAESQIRIKSEQLLDQIFGRSVEVALPLDIAIHYVLRHRLYIGIEKRSHPRTQLIQQHTQAPQISSVVMALLLHDLRRYVSRSATEGVGQFIFYFLSKSEIYKSHVSLSINQHVLRLQISVDYFAFVEYFQSSDDFGQIKDSSICFELHISTEAGEQFSTLDELHAEVKMFVILEGAVEMREESAPVQISQYITFAKSVGRLFPLYLLCFLQYFQSIELISFATLPKYLLFLFIFESSHLHLPKIAFSGRSENLEVAQRKHSKARGLSSVGISFRSQQTSSRGVVGIKAHILLSEEALRAQQLLGLFEWIQLLFSSEADIITLEYFSLLSEIIKSAVLG